MRDEGRIPATFRLESKKWHRRRESWVECLGWLIQSNKNSPERRREGGEGKLKEVGNHISSATAA